MSQRVLMLMVFLVLTLGGCLGPPDSFGDMWKRIEDVGPPEEFGLVGKEQSGLRSNFMAAGPPRVTNFYAAPWDGGAVCDRLRDMLRAQGKVEEIGSGSCRYQTTIGSGWAAWFVNVWSYRVEAHAADPGAVAERTKGDDCPAIRERQEADGTSYFLRHVYCWVGPGEALATLTLHGKVGW